MYNSGGDSDDSKQSKLRAVPIGRRQGGGGASVAPYAHSWAKLQKPAKNEIQKIREIDGSYLRLQRFDKFYMWSEATRKRKLCEFAETRIFTFGKFIFGEFEQFGTTVQRNGEARLFYWMNVSMCSSKL